MNATQKARAGYDSARPIRTPRNTEYEAFARITSRLKATATPPVQFSDLADAIHDNRRLWTILAIDVASDNNSLPVQLRAQILSLAEFTRQHSSKALRSKATVAPLIEINMAIMRGLQGRGTSGQTA